jgi:hypothetical protein
MSMTIAFVIGMVPAHGVGWMKKRKSEQKDP